MIFYLLWDWRDEVMTTPVKTLGTECWGESGNWNIDWKFRIQVIKYDDIEIKVTIDWKNRSFLTWNEDLPVDIASDDLGVEPQVLKVVLSLAVLGRLLLRPLLPLKLLNWRELLLSDVRRDWEADVPDVRRELLVVNVDSCSSSASDPEVMIC